jgi:hypothetical protein
MRKTTVLFSLVALVAAFAMGCSAHYKILSVPAMSMTMPSMPAGSAATAAGRVTSQFCTGDDPVVSKDANVGMIDEAVAKAQQQSGAKYLSDVTVSGDGNCVYVEATAMK